MPKDYLPGTFFGPTNLVDLLRHRVRCQPEDTAFIFLVDGESEEVQITYRELDRQARAIAAWLASRNLAGQRALLLYPAGLEFIAAFFGCLYAKVTAVPVYPPRRNRLMSRIQSIAKDARAKVALTTDSVFHRVRPLTQQTEGLRDLAWLATSHLPEGLEEEWKAPDLDTDTLAFLQYTSGSTGTPKGVMLNHANLIHNSALIAHAFEHTRSCMGVFWLPSYHDMGLIGGILQPIYLGCPNILMSPMSFLQKPFRWLAAISRYSHMTSGSVTSGGPNFAYELCVEKITPEQRETLDLSQWGVAFNGAEPVRDETLDRFSETFESCGFRREAFYPCFGLAEATLIVSGGFAKESPRIQPFDAAALAESQAVECAEAEEGVRRLVGCGGALPDEKIVITDPETRTTCVDGTVGEIWVKGPSVAQGYWQKPDATETTFRAYLADTGEGPFLRTGDLGFLNQGELFVTGRIKDMLIVHGVNHYPHDIELTVQKGAPHLRSGCGAAFVVSRNKGKDELVVAQEVERHTDADLDEIIGAIQQAVLEEHDLALDAIVLVKPGKIPKTSSGKIQRHACRDGYLDGSLPAVRTWHVSEGMPKRRTTRFPAVAAPAGKNGHAKSPTAATLFPESMVPTGPAPRDRVMSVPGRNKAATASVDRLDEVAAIVVEEVRKVARHRATDLTLESNIAELGLDSLERMEIVAALEERFGGRFPEEVLPEMETCRQVVEGVMTYLGQEARPRLQIASKGEIPEKYYRVDKFPECAQLEQSLGLASALGLENPFFKVHQSVLTNRTVIDGQEMVNFSSFNYIGMSGHPAVNRAAKEAVDHYGTSVSASRLVSGEKDLHLELESAISEMLGTEDSVIFSAGHSTNESVIGHLFGPGDLILHDGLAHNSIVQGAILSGARRRPFRHNDCDDLERLLAEHRRQYRRVLVAVEGVYSMDGDFPDLPRMIDIKRRHKAMLFIDEAHSVGTMGRRGRGMSEYYDVDPQEVDIWMGTLSKALGSCGGYISGCKELIRYIKYTAPAFVFATGISPANTAAALAAIRVLQADPGRVARLKQRSELFLRLVQEQGLNTGTSNGTPVVPVILGNSVHCLKVSSAMFARRINVQPILHPAVEESAARLRFFITSEHTEEEIRRAARVLIEELRKLAPEHLNSAASTSASLKTA